MCLSPWYSSHNDVCPVNAYAQQLAEALRLIATTQYSTPLLAEELGILIPTMSGYVAALRERGHDIRAAREAEGWRYAIASTPDVTQLASAELSHGGTEPPATGHCLTCVQTAPVTSGQENNPLCEH